ncbi:MAG: mechanosensitive ion channel family protein [Bacilli bacterium]
MEQIKQFLIDEATKVITTAILILATIVLFVVVGLIVGRFIRKQKEKRRRAVTLAKMVQSIFRYTVSIIIIIVILDVWGLNVMPVLAGAGILGIVIGFGAQSLIRDLLAGIAIVFENYYDIDDVIEINGFKGRVDEVGLKSTKIVNWKGEVKTLFNGDIKDVTNFSKNPSTGIVDVEVDAKESIDRVIFLLDEKLINLKDTFPQILEGPNVIGVTKVFRKGFIIRITVKTTPENHYAVEREVQRMVKEVFDQNNILFATEHLVIDREQPNQLS